MECPRWKLGKSDGVSDDFKVGCCNGISEDGAWQIGWRISDGKYRTVSRLAAAMECPRR
jgi:hypothetical protein